MDVCIRQSRSRSTVIKDVVRVQLVLENGPHGQLACGSGEEGVDICHNLEAGDTIEFQNLPNN